MPTSPIFPFSSILLSSKEPLLPQHNRRGSRISDLDGVNAIDMHDLSSSPASQSRIRETTAASMSASPSPPPAFYRDIRSGAGKGGGGGGGRGVLGTGMEGSYHDEGTDDGAAGWGRGTPSGSERSGERSGRGAGLLSQLDKEERRRRIQFMAPPPPIAGSVVLIPGALERGGSANVSVRGGGRNGRVVEESGLRKSMMGSMIGVLGGSSNGGGGRRYSSGGIDPLIGLERREKAIQSDLQFLLDRQSEGLLKGVGGDVGEGSEGSNTPTERSYRSGSRVEGKLGNGGVMPVRQPKRKQVSLRGARKGLLRDMRRLGEVKGEEAGVLEGNIARIEGNLKRIGGWEGKIGELKRDLANVERGDGEDEFQSFQREMVDVDLEIRELEERLMGLKGRKRWLDGRIEEGVNRREARGASYQAALREIDGEVVQFLRRVHPAPLAEIPVEKRTLELVKEGLDEEAETFQDRWKKVNEEKEALEEGSKVWEECMVHIMSFEDELRSVMTGQKAGNEIVMKDVIGKMKDIMTVLKNGVDEAERKGWKLLVVAIGAEFEAFREGEAILRGALGMVDEVEMGKDPFDDGDGDGDAFGGVDGTRGETRFGGKAVDNGLLELHVDEHDEGESHVVVEGEHDDHGEDVRRSLEREMSVGTEESEDEGPDLEGLMVDKSHLHS